MPHFIREARPTDVDAISRLITLLGYTLGAEEVIGRLAVHADGMNKVLVAESEGASSDS